MYHNFVLNILPPWLNLKVCHILKYDLEAMENTGSMLDMQNVILTLNESCVVITELQNHIFHRGRRPEQWHGIKTGALRISCLKESFLWGWWEISLEVKHVSGKISIKKRNLDGMNLS